MSSGRSARRSRKGDRDRHRGDAVIEILAELACAARVEQAGIGRGEQADVDRARLRGTDPFDRLFLERAQELDCALTSRQWMSSRNRVPPWARSSLPWRGLPLGPRSVPNNSMSSASPCQAAQFITTKGLRARALR
jgi:hypothetical protein